jgi:hypothetical protein
MNTPRSAVSPLALPELRSALRIEVARCEKWTDYARLCGTTRTDLEAQIAAALSGAPTWTDTAGSVWGPGALLVGGTVPAPGGNSFTEPLGY